MLHVERDGSLMLVPHRSRFLFRVALVAMLFLCGRPVEAVGALEDRSMYERPPELEGASGPIRRVTIRTKDAEQTLTLSSHGRLLEKVTRTRADPSASEERVTYRYDGAGKLVGEWVHDADDEWIPLRLYAYDSHGRLAGEAAYHLCRTFSALHLYAYDEADRLIEHRRFESRRLSRRELRYGANGRLESLLIYRNGRLSERADYQSNELGQAVSIEWASADGSPTRRISMTYDDRGQILARIERYPSDAARDRVEIFSYQYDEQGNWTRRTVIRAVNPVDDEGQPSEDPVEVTERTIVYAPSTGQ